MLFVLLQMIVGNVVHRKAIVWLVFCTHCCVRKVNRDSKGRLEHHTHSQV